MKAVEAALMAKARALGPRQKRLRLPPPPAVKIPIELERQYYKDLRAEVVARLGRITERILVPALPSLLRSAREDLPTVDAADGPRRLDSYARELDVLFNGMRVAYATELTPDEIEALARKYSIRGEQWNKTDLAKSLQRVLGINPLVAEPYLPAVMRQFIDENTNLIRSIGTEYFGKVQQDTYKFIQEGVYNKEYAKQISAEFSEEFKRQYERGILKRRVTNADARARLIARDQISKYNGQLNQTRQTALGITKYRWVTVGDDRVRESHRSKNGKIFSWDSPPSDTGHPGDDYQCRCVAAMVADEGVTENPTLLALLNS
jgi:SPP1 gp7 family putative phage head morphogenesis protein